MSCTLSGAPPALRVGANATTSARTRSTHGCPAMVALLPAERGSPFSRTSVPLAITHTSPPARAMSAHEVSKKPA
jgi:hypothetical protein